MRTSMLVSLINSGGKLATTEHGKKVVEAHYKGALDRMNRARGPDRDKARHEANAIAYAWNNAQAKLRR
jgi:hypothetical protein